MKKSKLSQVVVAAAVVATLGLTAACSGDSDGGDKSGKDKGGAGQSGGDEKKGAPALTEAQLKSAIIDKLAGYQFEVIPENEFPKESAKVSDDCKPLSDMTGFTSDPAPKARIAKGGLNKEFTLASAALLAHEQADAEKVLADVRAAVDKCKNYGDSTGSYTGIASQPAPEVGDEAVAYKMSAQSEGENGLLSFNVVRSGSTVAVFFAADMSGKGTGGVPKELVDAQIKRLEAVK
ncbi:hypothetical protein H9Y04_32615 [Streptomyces sp. TRM66268-LWL]|uniref:Lipoprotein n=1 Tax=Streptomyces polyasparticus TaxID=2767826 RepID=A0ABR7SRY0_9ACTN|nr:hypothetical protein [Streptomyces polyasparticus]MBC9717281.1 hypothetical protein [Streptomyces polyasparticus]